MRGLVAWMRRLLGSLMPAGLAGSFLILAVGRVSEPGDDNRLVLLFVGWLYAVGVVGLIRLFRIAPWGYPFAGALCGPVPLVLFLSTDQGGDERGAFWLAAALGGVLIGCIEWARVRREDA